MKVQDALDCYYESSGKVSELTRQLALAGIAVVWIFRVGTDHAPKFPKELLYALLFFVLTLAVDLLQYLYKTLLWGRYHYVKEKQQQAAREHAAKSPARYKKSAPPAASHDLNAAPRKLYQRHQDDHSIDGATTTSEAASGNKIEIEFEAPEWFNWTTLILFYLKCATLAAGAWYLGHYLMTAITLAK